MLFSEYVLNKAINETAKLTFDNKVSVDKITDMLKTYFSKNHNFNLNELFNDSSANNLAQAHKEMQPHMKSVHLTIMKLYDALRKKFDSKSISPILDALKTINDTIIQTDIKINQKLNAEQQGQGLNPPNPVV